MATLDCRFLQPDPKQFAAGDYNFYRYCHNDPVNKIDPTGNYYVVRHQEGSRDYTVEIPIQYKGPGNSPGVRAGAVG